MPHQDYVLVYRDGKEITIDSRLVALKQPTLFIPTVEKVQNLKKTQKMRIIDSDSISVNYRSSFPISNEISDREISILSDTASFIQDVGCLVEEHFSRKAKLGNCGMSLDDAFLDKELQCIVSSDNEIQHLFAERLKKAHLTEDEGKFLLASLAQVDCEHAEKDRRVSAVVSNPEIIKRAITYAEPLVAMFRSADDLAAKYKVDGERYPANFNVTGLRPTVFTTSPIAFTPELRDHVAINIVGDWVTQELFPDFNRREGELSKQRFQKVLLRYWQRQKQKINESSFSGGSFISDKLPKNAAVILTEIDFERDDKRTFDGKACVVLHPSYARYLTCYNASLTPESTIEFAFIVSDGHPPFGMNGEKNRYFFLLDDALKAWKGDT